MDDRVREDRRGDEDAGAKRRDGVAKDRAFHGHELGGGT